MSQNQENGVATKTDARLTSLLANAGIKKRFEDMLGKRAPAFLSSIISAVNANPSLKNCEPMSVISAAAVAAAMDLPINPSLGQAHMVPYKDGRDGPMIAQFQMGWKGFVQLALRTGQYKRIHATHVFEGQITKVNSFSGDYEFQEEATSNKVVGYMFYFRLLNGFEKYCYMTKEQVEAHAKEYSMAYRKGFGPWKDDFDAMALKTVVKLGLSKWGVLSVEMQKAIEVDQGRVAEDGSVLGFPDAAEPAPVSGDATEPKKVGSRLESIIGAKAGANQVPSETSLEIETNADAAENQASNWQ